MIQKYKCFALALGMLVIGAVSSVSAQIIINIQEESPVTLSSFAYTNSEVSFTVGDGYAFCANTAWATNSPAPTSVKIVPNNGSFIFGAVHSGGTAVVLNDVRSLRYLNNNSTLSTINGTLTCYALSPQGLRTKWYNGLFVDSFDGNHPNKCFATDPTADSQDACVTISVDELPSGIGGVYKYFIDWYVPASGAKYTLRDGYNTSNFNTITNWCTISPLNNPQGTTNCPGFATATQTIDAAITADSQVGTSGRVIVMRQALAAVASGDLLTVAALFPETPALSLERDLGNNVAAGYGSVSDFPATITAGTPNNPIVNNTISLMEGGSLTVANINPVTFTLTDDTSESTGNLLKATVSINFNGTLVTPTVNCGSSTLQTVPPITRTCTFDVVPPSTNFATDVNPGVYATGVSASVTITATDSLGQITIAPAIALHVNSSDNDAPVFTVSGVAVPDQLNNNMPTLTCSLATPTGNICNGNLTGFINGVAAAPANAIDELAVQTASWVAGTVLLDGSNIDCSLDQGSLDIFATFGGGPVLDPTGATNSYNLDYTLNGINTGSATCSIVITDAGTFPAGQNAVTTDPAIGTFRIVVTQ